MSRTNIAAVTFPGAYPDLPVSANSLDITLHPADAVNQNDTVLVNSKTAIIAYNSGAGAHTITVTSAPDSFDRTGDISAYSLGAGELAFFGPFKTAGWGYSGRLRFEANHAEILFVVVTLP